MGAFWKRLLACERRTQRYRSLITELTRQLRAAQQQLAQQRGQA
jgi:hypothetical protein